jgi:hypothetical protein
MQDEMMSQDAAFTTENKEDAFKFDEVKETSPESLTNEETKEDPEESAESVEEVDEDGQKVPYSRFKAKVDRVKEAEAQIQFLEEELEKSRNSRQESEKEEITPDDAWIKLYGDSDAAKEAYKIQLQRDAAIEERAIEKAIDRISRRESEEIERLSENESIIDENLNKLQEKLGKKLTSKQEEEILSIVDELSPVGEDGKYLGMISFDKAYEIYSLKNSSKNAPTNRARQDIAELTSGNSEGEIDSTVHANKKGWDSWREAI